MINPHKERHMNWFGVILGISALGLAYYGLIYSGTIPAIIRPSAPTPVPTDSNGAVLDPAPYLRSEPSIKYDPVTGDPIGGRTVRVDPRFVTDMQRGKLPMPTVDDFFNEYVWAESLTGKLTPDEVQRCLDFIRGQYDKFSNASIEQVKALIQIVVPTSQCNSN